LFFVGEVASMSEWIIVGIKICGVILFCFVFYQTGVLFIKRYEKKLKKKQPPERYSRGITFLLLVKNISKYFWIIVCLVGILGFLSVDIGPILAGAGIIGLVVGLGAQNIIKDLLAGIFMLFEDQFSVGDYVTISGVSGVIEEIGLRTTKIRAYTGELYVIPNGSIDKTTNFSKGFARVVIDVEVSVKEDINKTTELLQKIGAALQESKKEKVLEPLVVLGIISSSDISVKIRVSQKVLPEVRWAIEREIKKRIREEFNRAGILLKSC